MSRILVPLVTVLVVLVGAAPASAAFTPVAPAAGSSTALNKVKTDWSGACDAGLTCRSFIVAYSRAATVDGVGRLVEGTSADIDLDPYKVAYPTEAAALTVLSPTLNPALWHYQLQWRQCDANFNCTDQQSAVVPFTVAHKLVAPKVRVTERYKYIRQIGYTVSFAGNAPKYTVKGVVSVQKRRPNGKAYWAVSRRETQTAYGQVGQVRRYYNWKAGSVRRGTKLRIQATISAPGMKARTVTTYSTSV